MSIEKLNETVCEASTININQLNASDEAVVKINVENLATEPKHDARFTLAFVMIWIGTFQAALDQTERYARMSFTTMPCTSVSR